MCLAIPGKILEINENRATADFGGVKRGVQLDLLEDISKGDYVLVHVGYAIQTIDSEKAEEILKAWKLSRG